MHPPFGAAHRGEYRGTYYSTSSRAPVLTRVFTEEGIVGEAYAGDEASKLAQIVDVVNRELTPRLIGESALTYERCWDLGFSVTFDQLRDRRVGLVALASVDYANLGRIGKALPSQSGVFGAAITRNRVSTLLGGIMART